MKKNETYVSPKLTFVKTELFENVAAECWANPTLYCLEDPTDDDKCGFPGLTEDQASMKMRYADLKDYPTTTNGCNKTQIDGVKTYLRTTYGPGTGAHYLTDKDIDTIFASSGTTDAQNLNAQGFIHQVRSN